MPPAPQVVQAAPVELPRQAAPASLGFWQKWGGVVGKALRVGMLATTIFVFVSAGPLGLLPLLLWGGAELLCLLVRRSVKRQQEALRLMQQEAASAQNQPEVNRDAAPPQQPAGPDPVAAAAAHPRPEAGGARGQRAVPPQTQTQQASPPRPAPRPQPPAPDPASAAGAPLRAPEAAAGPSAVDPEVLRMARHLQLNVNRQQAQSAIDDWQQGADEGARRVLQRNINNREDELNLRGLDFSALPVQALRHFVWLKAIKLSPRLLHRAAGSGQAGAPRRAPATLDEASVKASLAQWRRRYPNLDPKHERFFLDAFRNGVDTLDLRGRTLPSLPDVVMGFPSLRTLVVSREFLARNERANRR